MKIYIVIEDNGYDGYQYPPDHYYTDKEAAQEYCDKCNKASGSKRDYFEVHELTPIQATKQ